MAHPCIHTLVCTYTYAYKYIYTCIYIYISIYTYIYIYICVCMYVYALLKPWITRLLFPSVPLQSPCGWHKTLKRPAKRCAGRARDRTSGSSCGHGPKGQEPYSQSQGNTFQALWDPILAEDFLPDRLHT